MYQCAATRTNTAYSMEGPPMLGMIISSMLMWLDIIFRGSQLPRYGTKSWNSMTLITITVSVLTTKSRSNIQLGKKIVQLHFTIAWVWHFYSKRFERRSLLFYNRNKRVAAPLFAVVGGVHGLGSHKVEMKCHGCGFLRRKATQSMAPHALQRLEKATSDTGFRSYKIQLQFPTRMTKGRNLGNINLETFCIYPNTQEPRHISSHHILCVFVPYFSPWTT